MKRLTDGGEIVGFQATRCALAEVIGNRNPILDRENTTAATAVELVASALGARIL